MGFREVRPRAISETFLEPEMHTVETGEATAYHAETREPGNMCFSLSVLHDYLKWVPDVTVSMYIPRWLVAQIVLGVVIAYLGIVTGGSYFGTANNRMNGILWTLFYQYQLGALMMMIGGIVVYDGVRRVKVFR